MNDTEPEKPNPWTIALMEMAEQTRKKIIQDNEQFDLMRCPRCLWEGRRSDLDLVNSHYYCRECGCENVYEAFTPDQEYVLRDGSTEWTTSFSSEIQAELQRAKSKFPDWPTDPIHAFAIVAEEFGEAAKEVLQLTYEPSKSTLERIRTEVVQLAAMTHRFLESLDRYEFTPSAQHKQK